MKIIYLAAFKANHPNWDVIYQDINGKRDIGGDMMDVDLTGYDVIIATPPCNYWSRANYRRNISEYALKTKDLLPKIIKKCIDLGKPFIIENVINNKLFKENGLLDVDCFIYEYGRHTYWSNIPFVIKPIKDESFNYKPIKSGKNKGKMGVFNSKNKRQGGKQVHHVIEYWLEVVHESIN